VVTLSRVGEASVTGPDSDRAGRHLAALCAHLGIRARHRLVVEEAIPSHAGLGSGTQIALAVAAALRTLHGLPLDPGADAMLLSRGNRSGIGIASFSDGGVIIDAGKGPDGGPPPVVARIPFPDEWRVILVLDKQHEGLHGEDEIEAFRRLPPFPREGVGEICAQVVMGVMPGLIQRDFHAFASAISVIQQMVGAHFAPAQGGAFTSRRIEALVLGLAEAGAAGIGQSSWGPTGFAFAPSEKAAVAFVDAIEDKLVPETQVRVVRGRNFGAKIAATGLDLVGN
jgi:beta-RFAP synthase